LVREGPPEYQRAGKENPKLMPFKEIIFEMVNVKGFRGSRIFEEIRSKGYAGGKTALYSYLEKIRIEVEKHYTPYETAPGEQSQFDWSPYTVLVGDVRTKIVVFSYINSFSRYQNYEVSLSEDQGSVFEALEQSLVASGGVPGRVQTDNAKVFVKNASKNNFQWNERYLHFCGHYGFEPTRSLPRHPWSKGKVEKPFQYLEDHFIAGSSFEDFEDLQRKLKDFEHQVNTRVHSTIKTTPEELVTKDREMFSPLPETGYIGIKEEIRKVSFDCLLSFNGSRYSAPWMFAGKQVWVKVGKGYYLEIYSQANRLVARHKLSMQKGAIVIENAHYRGNNRTTGNFQRLKELFSKDFPHQGIFLEKLQAQKRINAHRHLFQFLELAKLYDKKDLDKAIGVCIEYNVFNASFIAGFLEKNFKPTRVTDAELKLHAGGVQLSLDLNQGEAVVRSLGEYQLTLSEQTQGE
jgi:transposase